MMKIEIRLRIDAGDDGPRDEEILVLDKPHAQLEQIGLSLAEARELLGRVQERVVGAQATAFVEDNRHCDACGRRLWSKGRTSLQFRTCSGLRTSGLGREIIAVSGSDYLRMKLGLGSE